MVALIEPKGVEVLYYTTSSCGHAWASALLSVSETLSLSELAKLGPGSEAFGNLSNYANRHRITRLSRMDVLRYFVSDHITDANRSANFDPDKDSESNDLWGMMLANCAIWPLEESGNLEIGDRAIKVRGAEDLGGQGHLFLHRRMYFRLPVTDSEANELKGLFKANSLLLSALDRVGDELVLPIVPQKHK